MGLTYLKYVVMSCMVVSLGAQSFGHDVPAHLIPYVKDLGAFAVGVAMLAYQWETGNPNPGVKT